MAVRKEYNQSWNPFWMNMPEEGTKDYEELENLPEINNTEVKGDKTGSDYGLGDVNQADIAPEFSAETAYSKDDIVYHDGTLYKFTADHAAGAWTGEDASATKISENLGGEEYVLPTASASTLGGVKVGSGLSIDASGVLSAAGGGDVMAITGDNGTLSKVLQNCVAALPNGGSLEVFIPRLVYTLKNADIMQFGCTEVTDGTTEAVATLKVYPLVDGKWVETILNQYSNINIDTTKFITNGGNCKAVFAKIVNGAEIVLTNCVLRVQVSTGASTPAMWALYTNGDVFARSVSGTGEGIYAVTTNLAYPTAATPSALLTGVRQVPYKQYLTRHNGGMVSERSSFYSGSFMAGLTEMTGASSYGGYLYKASWGNQYNGCVDDIIDIAKYTNASQYVGGFTGKMNGLLYTYDSNANAYGSFEGVDLQPAIEDWVLPIGYNHSLICVSTQQ